MEGAWRRRTVGGAEMSIWRSAWYNPESSTESVIIYRPACRNGVLLKGREGETVQVRKTYTSIQVQERGSWGWLQMAPHSSTFAGKSHGLRSLVGCSPWGHEESDTTSLSLSLFTFMHWRRQWQPTPVFLPGESQGPGSLVGCRLWGGTESDTTEVT